VRHLAPGPYDYIDCCGVLHHLESPEAGLASLAEVLAPAGGLGIMVYGELGRSGVYPLQDLLRRLTAGEPLPTRVEATRRLIADLPETHLFRRNHLIGADLADDAGVVDLLLHARDVAYRVPDVFRLLDGAGLRLVSFAPAWLYEPRYLLKDPVLAARAAALPRAEQAAVAELVTCVLHKHSFYAVRRDNPVTTQLTVADPDSVLVPFFDQILRDLRAPGAGTTAVHRDQRGLSLSVSLSLELAGAARLIDGSRTLAQIHHESSSTTWEVFVEAFAPLYDLLVAIGAVHLRRAPGG
jgi:SAM-dependent methyltransferase